MPKGIPKNGINKGWIKRGTKFSKEYREKISFGHKGKKPHQFTEICRKRMSIAKLGKEPPNKGKRMPQISGKNNYRWKGGYENHLWHNRRRRIMKLRVGGSHTLAEWEILKAQYNWTCPCCHKSEPEIRLSEDHIIPLTKGGSDNIENIQPLCRSCNSKKYITIIKYGN